MGRLSQMVNIQGFVRIGRGLFEDTFQEFTGHNEKNHRYP
jgi:hypothetical protein